MPDRAVEKNKAARAQLILYACMAAGVLLPLALFFLFGRR